MYVANVYSKINSCKTGKTENEFEKAIQGVIRIWNEEEYFIRYFNAINSLQSYDTKKFNAYLSLTKINKNKPWLLTEKKLELRPKDFDKLIVTNQTMAENSFNRF